MVGGAPGTLRSGCKAGDFGSGCLNPLDPQSMRLFTPDGAFHTVGARSNAGRHSDGVCIALDGDKLKPREDQRKGGNGFGINDEGAGYTLTGADRHGVAYSAQGGEVASTITRQISEQSGQDNRANAVVQCFSKVSHPSAPNGEGERRDEREVAQTRNTFDNGEKRCQEVVVSMAQNTRDEVRIVGGDGQIAGALPAEPGMKQQTHVVSTTSNGLITKGSGEAILSDEHHMALQCGGGQCGQGTPACVISTNSNGEDVAATISANMSKLGGDNQTTFGGVLHHPPRGRSARWE